MAGRRYRRTIAPRVTEEHARGCALSTRTGRRCSCDPVHLARVKRDGREHARAFADPADALAWAQNTRQALRAGAPGPARHAPAPALAAVAVSFLHRARAGDALTRSRCLYSPATLAGYEVALRLDVLPHVDGRTGLPFGEFPADSLDERTVQGLVDVVAARRSAAVARRAQAALAAVLADAFNRGLVDTLPARVRLPPPPGGRTRTVALAQGDALLAAAVADDEHRRRSLLGPLVAVLLGTGCRISEALGLTWGPGGLDLDHDPPHAVIARATTKTDAGARTVPLDRDTAALLRRHRLATGRPADGAPVFADEHGRTLPRHGRVRSGLARVAKAAGLPDLTPHVLRHAHATWLASAGVPAPVAAARLGHADGGALFMRTYAHPGAADGEAALRALEALRTRDSRATAEPRRSQDG